MATRHGRRARLALATLAASALLVSACGDGDSSGDDGGQITLKVQNFGLFGYKDSLYAQYMKDHPNIKIVEQAEGDISKYTNALTQHIAAGRGAGDVVAIEEGSVVQFLQAKDRFVNMQDHGSNEDATENRSGGEDEGGEGHRGGEHLQGHGEQADADGDVEAAHEEHRALVTTRDRETGERLHRRRGCREDGPPDDGDDVDVDGTADDDRRDDRREEGDAGTDEDRGARHRDAGPPGASPQNGERHRAVARVGAEQV